MSKQRERRRSQGGTTPTTKPRTEQAVAQFSVSEVAQFSMSLDTGERLCEGAGACLEVTPLAPPQKPAPTVSEWLQLHERGVVDAAELRAQLGLQAEGSGGQGSGE